MLSPTFIGTTLWNDNVVLRREVCSQRKPIFGTAFLLQALGHNYGENVLVQGTNGSPNPAFQTASKEKRSLTNISDCWAALTTPNYLLVETDCVFMGRRKILSYCRIVNKCITCKVS